MRFFKTGLLFLVFSALATATYGQEKIIVTKPAAFDSTKPLVLVDSVPTVLNTMIVSPNKIESVTVIKDANLIKRYGNAGRNGVILVKMKENTKLLRLPEIFEEFGVKKEYQSLGVSIDNTQITNPELIAIDETEIVKVEITTALNWIDVQDATPDRKFINIVTKKSTPIL